MATKSSIADVSAQLYKLLEPFGSDERKRIVDGTLTLLGESVSTQSSLAHSTAFGSTGGSAPPPRQRGQGSANDERTFFDEKDPKTKIEELATAARFLELGTNATSHTKEDFQGVFTNARRNFDNRNFARDIDNGRTSGFFSKGGSAKTGYTLSYYGQNYVDALPDRAAAKALRRPTRKSARKAGSKKAAAKAASKPSPKKP